MPKKILIIDDEKDFCYFVKENLEAAGNYEVETCYDGATGIKLAKELHPDLILLDIVMPEMEGPDVARELKDNKDTQRIPIIFLTAIIREEETKKEKHKIKGWYYISKPVKINELKNVINSVLSKV